MCEPFFGWSNRETWCMALHLSNEQQTDYDIADRAAHAGSVYSLAEQIRDYFDDMEEWAPEHHRFIRDDVGSLYRVDWLEIARHYWADYGIEDEGGDD